ncbi:chloramphenicol O-acetyltransferase type A [Prevotellaceae bacterium HUN156]|nr:chloramphenicol O-acetyltransferase type A [Prevotellaceae bacterium HUN156]
MKKEINPQETSRAEAFSMWMSSPQPMVTLTKTFDVSRLVKVCRRTDMKFTSLMCWCIAKAASNIEEFYLLPENGKLFQFDRLAVNIVVQNIKGGISLCDVPYSDDMKQFNADYLELTCQAAKTCQSSALEDYMIIGTSALPQTELDAIVNQYSGRYNNPFLAWGRYRKGWFKTTLPISFQFHHAQMDGGHAVRFLERLQQEINNL